MEYIPVYQPYLHGNEKKYVNQCLDTTWISSRGYFVKDFESNFEDFIKTDYSTSVTNGTAAVHLALLALGIGPGDEVITPTLSYIASANPILYCGATPVFVDSHPKTWQMEPVDWRQKVTEKTKAVLAVHLYGHPCDMGNIVAWARKLGLFVIEDCAEAFGSKIGNAHVGNFGDIAAWSFFGNKTITTGEGGMVSTNNKALFDRAFRFKGQGLAAYREYWHDIVGYNYRMTNICAAIGVAQLEQADTILKKKRYIAHKYTQLLKDLPLEFQTELPLYTQSHWMFNILVNPHIRDSLREFLKENNIETRPVFYPIHTMPIYNARYELHPVAEDIASRGITLPSYPDLTEEQLCRITDTIKAFFINHSQ